MTFINLGIIEPILRALTAEGYQTPTPIQEQAIPILLRGKDLLGCAQTGTGKTAAFAIPILQHLYMERQQNNHMRKIRALVVTPTRELALQIGESFSVYGQFTGIRNTVIFGGVKQGAQVTALEAGVDVLVATPGRLLDLMDQGYISLDHVGWSVLDEADRMLDMGFIHDIKKIIARLPQKRQSLFFSATMPPEIVELSRKILGNPEKVTIQPEQTTAEKVAQSVYMVAKSRKPALLVHLLRQNPGMAVLVFTRTKHGADKVVRLLKKDGIEAAAIHGNKSQGARQLALGNFKSGRSGVLVATDIAARGIDIEELPLVINYDLPNIPETYVHRIGRTARAGMEGQAISFCDAEELPWLKDIQKLIRQTVPVVEDHPFVGEEEAAGEESPSSQGRRPSPGRVEPSPGNEGRSSRGNREASGHPRISSDNRTFEQRGRSHSARPLEERDRSHSTRMGEDRNRSNTARPSEERNRSNTPRTTEPQGRVSSSRHSGPRSRGEQPSSHEREHPRSKNSRQEHSRTWSPQTRPSNARSASGKASETPPATGRSTPPASAGKEAAKGSFPDYLKRLIGIKKR
jgi:ATP-dependent RNA helicase RhlE